MWTFCPKSCKKHLQRWFNFPSFALLSFRHCNYTDILSSHICVTSILIGWVLKPFCWWYNCSCEGCQFSSITAKFLCRNFAQWLVFYWCGTQREIKIHTVTKLVNIWEKQQLNSKLTIYLRHKQTENLALRIKDSFNSKPRKNEKKQRNAKTTDQRE